MAQIALPFPAQTIERPQTAVDSVRSSRLAFFALCCYLIAQGYTIPVLPVGPSWAVWPTLGDFAVGLLAISIFYKGFVSDARKTVWRSLLLVMFIIGVSYFGQTLWLGFLGVRQMKGTEGVIFGFFQSFRIVEFAFVFWAASRIPLTPARVLTLRRVVMFVYLFLTVMIFLTFRNVVPTASLAPQIPRDPTVAGPWAQHYIVNWDGEGWGTIGYDHSYPASQMLLLTALHIHLCLGKRKTLNALFLLVMLVAIFLTGSRTVLVGAFVYALVMWLEEPHFAIVAAVFLVIGLSLVVFQGIGEDSPLSSIIRRQSMILNPTSDGFSGRNERWASHLDALNQSPVNWVIGAGFGATFEFGTHAHQNYLQILSETGFAGLIVAAMFASTVLRTLWKVDTTARHAIFWVTVAFLVTALTEETFYPIAHKGHFIGFYLASLAITLRRSTDVETEVLPAAEHTQYPLMQVKNLSRSL